MAHQSRLAGFIIDCQDTPADEGARFWATALGLQAQPSYGEDGAEYADLQGAPAGLNVEVQRVAHPHGCTWTSRATTSMPRQIDWKNSARAGSASSNAGG